MQNGKESGQSVPHVHVHVLPRKIGDFQRNDDIYEMLDKKDFGKDALDAAEIESDSAPDVPGATAVHEDDGRLPRTKAEMAAEAAMLRTLFPDNTPVDW